MFAAPPIPLRVMKASIRWRQLKRPLGAVCVAVLLFLAAYLVNQRLAWVSHAWLIVILVMTNLSWVIGKIYLRHGREVVREKAEEDRDLKWREILNDKQIESDKVFRQKVAEIHAGYQADRRQLAASFASEHQRKLKDLTEHYHLFVHRARDL